MTNHKITCFLLILIHFLQTSKQQDLRLETLGPLASDVASVSGFSSGGALSLQFYLSHSSVLRGCAIFSGMMYECGLEYNVELFKLLQCVRGSFNYSKVVKKIKKGVHLGLFDPLSNLKIQRHYISHGSEDSIVFLQEGHHINRFLRRYGTNASVYFNETKGSHGYPTVECGLPCETVFPPTVNGCLKCGWSGAFESLNHIYGGGLSRPKNSILTQCDTPDDPSSRPDLYPFDQREFFPNKVDTINMDQRGYIYIPKKCKKDASNCTLHVHFHGCGQEASSRFVQTRYIKCSGIMAVAKANNIIVIFPQATFGMSSISSVMQCWDFIGYTGSLYGTKKGVQIIAVKAMMDRVLGKEPRLQLLYKWSPKKRMIKSNENSVNLWHM